LKVATIKLTDSSIFVYLKLSWQLDSQEKITDQNSISPDFFADKSAEPAVKPKEMMHCSTND